MRGLFRLVIGVLLLLGLAPAQAGTLDEILKAGVIRVGVNPTLPPRALYNDKNEIDDFGARGGARDLAQARGGLKGFG